MSRRTLARPLTRIGATALTAGAITLMAAAPASAHVTVAPSTAEAGSYTVLTVALGHGCDGSGTTALDVQIPEEILSVTPARNPYWTAELQMEQLDEPVADAHGNEVTERVASVVFTADPVLPDGVRDSMELQFQIPEDMAGEDLWFPTIQECEQGETGWTQIPEDGQDPHSLETPAPGFTVTEAASGGHGSHGSDTSAEDASMETAAAESDESGSNALGIAGLVAGLLGLAAGATALARSKSAR